MLKRVGRLLSRSVTAPPPAVGQTPAAVVHAENEWRLLRYHARPEGLAFRTPILLVPSLINRHYVLDLMPGKSFVAWLVARGHDVFIIDWGTPTDEDRYLTFDDICDRYLGRALRVTRRLGQSDDAHVLGYCLGGTLAAIYAAAHRSAGMKSLLTLAAPIDFSDDGMLGAWTRVTTFDLEALVAATGNVPWRLMQTAFHLLRPTMNLAKAVGVLDRAWDDPFLDGFFALETWSNDNVSFPGACYARYISALYRDNELVRGDFSLSGRPAALANIVCPTMVVSFAHDMIVPEASARALHEHVGAGDRVHVHLPGGHVGAVVSRKASSGLWPQLAAFWEARDGVSPRSVGLAASPRRRPPVLAVGGDDQASLAAEH
ncbi:MAG: alpha/beta fold hydrolase [Myxococcota bacterium]